MKKLLSILIAVTMLASAIPLSIAANETPTETPALPAPDLAYTSIGNAIATDAGNGTTTELAKTNWSFQHGNSIEALADLTVTKTDSFGAFTSKIPATTPTAYRFNSVSTSDHIQNVAAYNSTTLPGLEAMSNNDLFPSSGIIFSVSQRVDYTDDDYFAITYTAPEKGAITLSDPSGGRIASIWSIGKDSNGATCNPNCLYYSGKEGYGGGRRNVEFGIYKNGERIWPTEDDFLFHHTDGSNRVYSVIFPTVKDISVKKGDKIQLIFDGSQTIDESTTMTFALNPQVTYQGPDLAYETIGNAIAKDVENGTLTELAKTDWSFQHGDTFANLTDYTLEKTGGFGTYRFSGTYTRLVPASTPTGYIFNPVIYDVYDENVAVYDSATYNGIKPNKENTLPAKGVIFSVSQHNTRTEDDWFSMTYTAPSDGFITLSDPDNGMIASLTSLGTTADGEDCKTLCVNDGVNKQVYFAIYKNGAKIWPTDSDNIVFNGNNYAVDFPSIEHLSVQAGDIIQLAFNGTSTSGSYSMAFALNPQVEYVDYEIGDVNKDWDIDIRDLVTINEQIDKEYDALYDLNEDTVVDVKDLLLMKQYLLGIIKEF